MLIEVRDLVKCYPGVKAVDGISFEVEKGTCFGLLGPNGAGKTTTLEMMEGFTRPTGGEIRYRGRPLDGRYREEIGIQFQTTALQDFQTVRESLVMFAALYRRNADLDALVELCQLGEFLDRDTRKLSGGQRQRLLLAIALGVLQITYSSPRDGYKIHPLSVADVDNLGKHLDKDKGQNDSRNRCILDILDRVSSLEGLRWDGSMEQVARQALKIRSCFFDNAKMLEDCIPQVLLVQGDYTQNETAPRRLFAN